MEISTDSLIETAKTKSKTFIDEIDVYVEKFQKDIAERGYNREMGDIELLKYFRKLNYEGKIRLLTTLNYFQKVPNTKKIILKIMALCTQHTNQQTLKTPIIQKNKRCQYLVPPFASVGKSTAVNNLTPITTVPKSTLVKTGVSKIGHSTVYMTDLN